MLNRLRSRIQNLTGGAADEASRHAEVLRPEVPFFAVGDIHGSLDALKNLLAKLDSVAEGSEHLVFLGDYIDRGPKSRQVLDTLYEASSDFPDRVTCIRGNHEQMLIDFIDDPAGRGADWLQNGGLETLASYGIQLHHHIEDADRAVAIADALEAALGADLQRWLRTLPLKWSSGNVHCVHAALDPKRSPRDQRQDVLLWGHPDFLRSDRDDGQVVVHGHTVVPRATRTGNRISIDTGVYRTGRLSAAHVASGTCKFYVN